MRLDTFVPRRQLVAGTIAAAFVACAVPNAFSADRVVLGEFFTWINCPACDTAEPLVDILVDRYGADGSSVTLHDRLALLTLHLWDGYEVPWGTARQGFYSPGGIFQGTPCFVHDGLYDAWPIDTYQNKFLDRVTVPTDVTMAIYAEALSANEYGVTVEVCLEAGADPVNLKVHTIVAEDHYPISDPQGDYLARNFFRSAETPTTVALTPGQCVEVTNTVTVSGSWTLENLVLIAWAQVPNASGPAEVHQAAIDAYPWEPAHPPCPWDCQAAPDGSVGVNDFLQMLADWGGNSPCDFDGEGVGVTDFLALLANWGACPE
jgi:hypothetical protein